MAHHKPYRHTAGAYSTRPQLRQSGEGRWTARGQIEQWKASLGDVYGAAQLALDGREPALVTVAVARTSGSVDGFGSLGEFRTALEQIQPETVFTVRVDANLGAVGNAVILVRRQIPAVLVEVAGPDRAIVLGLAQLVHARLMVGYVDPLGGARGFLSLVVAMLPVVVVLALLDDDLTGWPIWLRIVSGVVLVAASLGALAWGSELARKKSPLELTTGPISSRSRAHLVARIGALYQRRWVNRIVSLVGLLALGVSGSKIAEWL